jgi:hypothetical protein
MIPSCSRTGGGLQNILNAVDGDDKHEARSCFEIVSVDDRDFKKYYAGQNKPAVIHITPLIAIMSPTFL